MLARFAGRVATSARVWGPLLTVLALFLVAPLLMSDFRLGLLGKFLTFAILSLALNLIWGYAGMLSLGHGVFFGLGALFIGTVLLFPSGIMGFIRGNSGRMSLRQAAARARALCQSAAHPGKAIGDVVRSWTTTYFPWKP